VAEAAGDCELWPGDWMLTVRAAVAGSGLATAEINCAPLLFISRFICTSLPVGTDLVSLKDKRRT